MKVKITDRNLWKEYGKILSIISTATSLLFLFIGINSNNWTGLAISICILLSIFLVLWIKANKTKKATLKINNSILEIGFGDIFEEAGFKVIAFNEFFDTQVDGVIISKKTLNGKYIERFYPNVEDLDVIISGDSHSATQIIGTCERKAGKRSRYRLGTIVKNGEFFLLAFSHFDNKNRAFLEISDYIACLMNMWNECDIHYGGNTVALPLLGSGITRFRGYENISDQELLETMIWTFKASRIKFRHPAKLKIVLHEEKSKEIDLYNITKQNS